MSILDTPSDEGNGHIAGLSRMKDAATDLRRKGYGIVFLKTGQKKPLRKHWTQSSQEPSACCVGDNLGILTGRLSGDLVCIDLDSPEALANADRHLPITEMIDGRNGKPKAHRFYRVTDIPPEHVSLAAGGIGGPRSYSLPGIDFLGTGRHVVVPPSVAKGEPRQWEASGEPLTLPFSDLWEAFLSLASACGVDVTASREKAKRRWVSRNPPASITDPSKRDRLAKAYLDRMDAAIQGKGGDRQTYIAACCLVEGFGYSPEDALPLMQHYNTKCEPPWDDSDLEHKLEQADANCTGLRGYRYWTGEGYCVTQDGEDDLAAAIQGLEAMGLSTVPLSQEKTVSRQIKWLYDDIIAEGALTLLLSEPKVGKTTFLSHLFKTMCQDGGGTFLARHVKPTDVWVFTEESNAKTLWKGRASELGINESRLHVNGNCWFGKPSFKEWQKAMQLLSILAVKRGIKLVVIDTSSEFLPYEDENKPTDVQNALATLKALTSQGVAVLIVHHMNKGAGKNLVSKCRGATSFTGAMDVILGLSRDKNERTLEKIARNGYGDDMSLTYDLKDGTVKTEALSPEERGIEPSLGLKNMIASLRLLNKTKGLTAGIIRKELKGNGTVYSSRIEEAERLGLMKKEEGDTWAIVD